MNTISQLREQAVGLIHKELEYISGFLHYDLEQFFDKDLIYFRSVFAFFKGPEGASKITGLGISPEQLKALISLVVGIELLSVGLRIHAFDIDGLKGIKPCLENEKIKEKTYTVDLLFGDIFYSRAVIYLLDFGDHKVFDEILNSLKTVHKSRLALHHDILEESAHNFDVTKTLKSRPAFFYGLNELFKTSFLIGLANAIPEANIHKIGIYYRAVSLLVILKTYHELSRLFFDLSLNFENSSYFKDAKKKIQASLEQCLDKIEEPLFENNLRSLSEIFT